jgi:putative alpha-1,2-mannosidase
MKIHGGHFSLVTERAMGAADGPVWVYRASGDGVTLRPQAAVAGAAGGDLQVKLEPWQQRRADDQARPDYNDHDWLSSERPVQMGADGDTTADAWYRTIVHIDTGGTYTLQAGGGDRATVFVDGHVAGSGNLHQGELPLQVPGGDHVLAIFTAEDGRDKLAGFTGDMSEADSKGLTGRVVLERGGSTRHELGGWKYLPSSAADTAMGTALPSDGDKGWRPYTIGQDAFDHREGYAWMRTLLPDPPAGVPKGVLYFRSVDENATVFLNGRRLARHEGWNIPFNVTLEGLDTMQRPLVLTILIENYSNEGGIDRPVQVNYLTDAKELTGWTLHGGVADPGTIHDWTMMAATGMGDGRDTAATVVGNGRDTALKGPVAAPCYYRTLFQAPGYQEVGPHPVWRVSTVGLGHGSVWVNGHNLGRYPEKIPAPGLYIPECWLKAGENELVIYDEDGRRPDVVTVRPEIAAGRYLTEYSDLSAQDLLSYVNPMIGTTKSDVYTRWGNEGGTYPGAVAPWGYMQMTPETRGGGGYDYGDTTIGWFSCVGHMSGYPEGSGGQIRIMPVRGGDEGDVAAGAGGVSVSASAAAEGGGRMPGPRAFLHRYEEARPGYYRVMFADDGTVVEATAGTRTGWLRCTFPPGVKPMLFVGGIGRMTRVSAKELEGETPATAIHFDRDIGDERAVEGGQEYSFASVAGKATVVVLGISVSAVGTASAEKNLQAEADPEGFDGVRKRTQAEWRKQLSVITVEDNRVEAKTIFYTALYHALLLPWIISDAEGRYRGWDGLVHEASGKNEYGGFSPWDTFRSLHPLLTLLFPGRQQDMLLSMLDIYRQTGYLPTGPMTGNHAVPIFVDSWLKGIRGFDPAEAYAAMRKGIEEAPYHPADRKVYRMLGYVPLTYPESVTRTVEYAYDDWALGRFAEQVLHAGGAAEPASGGSAGNEGARDGYSYRNLFDPEQLLLVPRDSSQFRRHPGTSGYKEGDAWVYTYFVPQRPKDLINLLGGDQSFAEQLDTALMTQKILFDNEPVFHIPYLFNDAGRPGKTQEWVSRLRDGRYAATPGGLPGNDDLGAFSSWYVFSALGFFPVCPGRPDYDLGTPLFRSAMLHLANGRTFTIKAEGAGRQRPYVRTLALNGIRYNQLTLSHALIVKGGELVEQMSDIPGRGAANPANAEGGVPEPVFSFSDVSVSKDKVLPDELLQVRFKLSNQGGPGTRIVVLKVNGHEYAHKNCLVWQGGAVVDSIGCRLYPFGKAILEIGGASVRKEVEVMGGEEGGRGLAGQAIGEAGQLTGDLSTLAVRELSARPLVRTGEDQSVTCLVQNIGGISRRYMIPVMADGHVMGIDTVLLEPGEQRAVGFRWKAAQKGLQMISVKDTGERCKVYSDPEGSLLLSLMLDSVGAEGWTPDGSGFGNRAAVVGSMVGATFAEASAGPVGGGGLLLGKDQYVVVQGSPSLDSMGETMTMMVRVYPATKSRGLVDIFTKGDNHVLQVKDGKTLTFFAGGWGRGDCTVDLPDDWVGHWHHLAGVCTGHVLLLYIDGRLAGKSVVDGVVNLSVANKWVLGRNEEFPGERIFEGRVRDVRVYAAALGQGEIQALASPQLTNGSNIFILFLYSSS